MVIAWTNKRQLETLLKDITAIRKTLGSPSGQIHLTGEMTNLQTTEFTTEFEDAVDTLEEVIENELKDVVWRQYLEAKAMKEEAEG